MPAPTLTAWATYYTPKLRTYLDMFTAATAVIKIYAVLPFLHPSPQWWKSRYPRKQPQPSTPPLPLRCRETRALLAEVSSFLGGQPRSGHSGHSPLLLEVLRWAHPHLAAEGGVLVVMTTTDRVRDAAINAAKQAASRAHMFIDRAFGGDGGFVRQIRSDDLVGTHGTTQGDRDLADILPAITERARHFWAGRSSVH